MQGVRRLLGAGIDSARLDAELLLGCALGMSREELMIAATRKVSVAESDRYEDLLRRRLNREPLAYITGQQEFFPSVFWSAAMSSCRGQKPRHWWSVRSNIWQR